jgi:hypothetical protein
MCNHNDTVPVKVKILADQAWEGRDTWKVKPIDRCIAGVVEELQSAGVDMRGSCCGHGKTKASIVLANRSEVHFIPPEQHLNDTLAEILRVAALDKENE